MSAEKQFKIHFAKLQDLFAKLSSEGVLSSEDISTYNKSQEAIVNYHSWAQSQLTPEENTSVTLPWPNVEFDVAWKQWKAYRKQQHKFTFKPIGESAALKDLSDISENNMDKAIEIINHSIKKTWMGLFPISYKPKRGEQKKEIDNLNEINHE